MRKPKFDMTPALGAKPLDVPPTLSESVSAIALEDVRIDGDFRWVTDDPLHAEYHQLPVELYSRDLMDLDLANGAAVFQFCSEHGLTHDCSRGWTDVGLTTVHGGVWGSPRARRVQSEVQQLLREHPESLGDQSWYERRVYHVDEVRLRLARIRNVARACSFLDDAIDESGLAELWDEGLDDVPGNRADARAFVCRSLTRAMSSVHPILAVSDEAASRHSISLFAGLALQIYNDIVVGARFRKCAKCGRLFVRHRSGRSDEDEQYQLRGDDKVVKFCSKKCSEAAASKQYRDRSKARRLRDSGLTVAETAAKMGLEKRDVELLLQSEGRERSRRQSV